MSINNSSAKSDSYKVRPHVQWRDLVSLKPWQVYFNCLLSLPFLVASWFFATHHLWLLAMIFSFFFFLTALRQAHDCYHKTIGLSNKGLSLMLPLLTSTMLCSTRAIQYTHLQHHKAPLSENDLEGSWSRLSFWEAICYGPAFSVRSQIQGITHGDPKTRRGTIVDFSIMFVIFILAMVLPITALRYHVIVMLIANSLTGFFAVWLVHHHCEESGVFARTERRGWVNFLTVNLLYHIEHHLFPQVPANHLPELAKRLDMESPEWTQISVTPKLAVKKPSE